MTPNQQMPEHRPQNQPGRPLGLFQPHQQRPLQLQSENQQSQSHGLGLPARIAGSLGSAGRYLLFGRRWPFGVASLFHAHRHLQREYEKLERENALLLEEIGAWRDIVFLFRQIPQLPTPARREQIREVLKPPERVPDKKAPPRFQNGRPSYAEIQRANRARMLEEANREAGVQPPDADRQAMRDLMETAADQYAPGVQQPPADGALRPAIE